MFFTLHTASWHKPPSSYCLERRMLPLVVMCLIPKQLGFVTPGTLKNERLEEIQEYLKVSVH